VNVIWDRLLGIKEAAKLSKIKACAIIKQGWQEMACDAA